MKVREHPQLNSPPKVYYAVFVGTMGLQRRWVRAEEVGKEVEGEGLTPELENLMRKRSLLPVRLGPTPASTIVVRIWTLSRA
jgi:hypothetical protein